MDQETVVRTPRENELAQDGWEKKFTAADPKLSESVRMYQELGFEVHLEPLTREEVGQDCTSCFVLSLDLFFTIYTRPLARK